MARRGDEGVLQLLSAGLPPRVRQLCLPDQAITSVGAAAISEALAAPNCALTKVDLAANTIGDAGALALAKALGTASGVLSLALGDNAIGAAGLDAVLQALRDGDDGGLLALDLGNSLLDGRRHNRFRGGSSAALAALLPSDRLTELCLRGCGLDHRCEATLVPALAAAGGSSRLSLLDLSSNQLGAAAGPVLAAAALTSADAASVKMNLICADVGLDDRGVSQLAQALRSSTGGSLALLDLFSNPFGDEGAAALLSAIDESAMNVDRLDIGCTNITDACVPGLLRLLAGAPVLLAFGLALTALSAKALAELAGSMTETDVTTWLDTRGTVLRMSYYLAVLCHISTQNRCILKDYG